MSAMTRAELKLFLKQRGMAGMDPADIENLADTIVVAGEAGATIATTNLDCGASGTAGSNIADPTSGS